MRAKMRLLKWAILKIKKNNKKYKNIFKNIKIYLKIYNFLFFYLQSSTILEIISILLLFVIFGIISAIVFHFSLKVLNGNSKSSRIQT